MIAARLVRPLAITGARLVDPASGYDGPGAVLIRDGRIAEVIRGVSDPSPGGDGEVIEAGGALLAPGLVDLRVQAGEPAEEDTESLESAARAAAAGGITTLVVQPTTRPPLDDPALVASVAARGRQIGLVTVLPAMAATRGLEGEALAEIGLMREAGAVLATDGDRPIADSRVLRRLLTYAAHFGVPVAHRPVDPWLHRGAVASEGELAGRLGLASEPVASETIGLARDLALARLTGGRLLVDQITAAEPLRALAAAKDEGMAVFASASINHLAFNEVDAGDYRAAFRLAPPLRAESDRLALVEALRTGVVDIVVSAHAAVTPEAKRAPFAEAAPGSAGLECLVAALAGLHREAGIPWLRLIEVASLAPARLIGSEAGRLAAGAPADLVLIDPETPWIVDPRRFASRLRDCAFAGRRVQGRVRLTIAGGRVVHDARG